MPLDQVHVTRGGKLAAFEAGGQEVRAGGAESRREVRTRVRRAVETLAESHPDRALLLVVHLGVIRELIPGTESDHLELHWTSLHRIRPRVS